MTGQPTITDTHTWDGTRHLPDWLHHDGAHLTLPGRDDNTPPQPGWMLVRWSDGLITVNSPQAADRTFGPDGIWGRLQRAEAELADRDTAESADAAAGSYAGSSEHAIAHPEPWLHIAFTSPDPTTANTSALALRDHLGAEFDGVGMRITTNAVDTDPNTPAPGRIETVQCCPHCGDWRLIPVRQYDEHIAQHHVDKTEAPVPDSTGPLTGIEVRDPCPWCESSPTRIPRQLMAEHVATVHPEVQTLDTAAGNPAATDIETTARVFAALHRSAEDTVTRVIDLYEQWVAAGPPPLGTSVSRWWDRRLIELRGAINPPTPTPATAEATATTKES